MQTRTANYDSGGKPRQQGLRSFAARSIGTTLVTISLFLIGVSPAGAVTISSGLSGTGGFSSSGGSGTSGTGPVSDGSDGIFQPLQSVNLDLPPQDVFNFTTITIDPSVSVGFSRNGSNMPIYFLATGDILIDGTLDGGSGPFYLSTPGSITLNGSLIGRDLTLSGGQIVLNSGSTIDANGSAVNLVAGSSVLNNGNLLSSGQISVSGPGSNQIAPVPIPASGSLLAWALGIMALLIGRRRPLAREPDCKRRIYSFPDGAPLCG